MRYMEKCIGTCHLVMDEIVPSRIWTLKWIADFDENIGKYSYRVKELQ